MHKCWYFKIDKILKNIQYVSEERTTQPQVYNAMENDVR